LIKLLMKSQFINYSLMYFCPRPFPGDRFKFVEHIQCQSKQNYIGLKRWRYFTKIIDLSQEEDEIFGHFRRTTRQEINTAKKEGIIFGIENNVEKFIEFYNLFAAAKKIAPTSVEDLRTYGNYLLITKAMQNNRILVMHANLIDEEEKRVRASMSASLFRYEDNHAEIALIGKANRFLHFADMLFFKERNFRIYDFGGYDSNIAVNKFKDSFGGILLEESIYTSYPLRIYRFLINKASIFLKKPATA
jgi:lipid II:glycine glycyltransferase (peptidoglycan interpeptide bridge formation enzyme)